MRELTPQETKEAAQLAIHISTELMMTRITNNLPLEVICHGLMCSLGSFLAQEHRVIVHSALETSNEMLKACETIMRNNAISTTPKPSNN